MNPVDNQQVSFPSDQGASPRIEGVYGRKGDGKFMARASSGPSERIFYERTEFEASGGCSGELSQFLLVVGKQRKPKWSKMLEMGIHVCQDQQKTWRDLESVDTKGLGGRLLRVVAWRDGCAEARIQSNILSWAPEFRSDPSELSVSGPKQVWRCPGRWEWWFG